MQPTERSIERRLFLGVRRRGGAAFKLVSPGTRGMPDRLVVWPAGVVHFVELKAPRGRVSRHQALMHLLLSGLGHRVYVLRSPEAVDQYLRAVCGR